MSNEDQNPMNVYGQGGPPNQDNAGQPNPQNEFGPNPNPLQVNVDIDVLSRYIADNIQRQAPQHVNANRAPENTPYPIHANYKDFTRYVPEFDGTTKTCSLNTFINYCESAREYTQAIGERPVVALLRSKCKGVACESLESFTISTIDDLINILRSRFITSKPLFAWLEELNTFEQKDKETLLAFYSRINLHLTQTQQAIGLSKLQDPEGAKNYARDMAINQFRRGVNPAYSAHIPITVFATLESIYQQTIEIEKLVGPIERNNKNQSTCLPISSQDNKNLNNKSMQNANTTGKLCKFCKKTNHVTDDCYALAKQNKQQEQQQKPQQLQQQQTTENKSSVSCNYCKKPGHVINDCRRRAYNNGKKAAANAGDDFPVEFDAILGHETLGNSNGKIDWMERCVQINDVKVPFTNTESFLLRARQKMVMFVRVGNTLETGYVPRIRFPEGVYAGEALVKNTDGKAYLYAINTLDKDVKVDVPVISLYPFDMSTDENEEQNEDSAIGKAKIHSIPSRTRENRVENVINLLRLDHLNVEERDAVNALVAENADLFHLPGDPLKSTSECKHRILTVNDRPVNTRQYRHPPFQRPEIEKQINDLLELNIIEPSKSPKLSEVTIGDAYPLPLITDILDQLGGAKYFSIFDLASGFHQIQMDPADKHKTAFTTPHGHYEFNRMPFGLKNAPATFQRLMDLVLKGLQGNELFVYLDDIVIYARSLDEHNSKFKKLAERLRNANLTLQTDKCEFLRTEVRYLGHLISADGVKPDPKNIEAVQKFNVPKTPKNVKEFLGLAGYYRRFIKNFAAIAKPLSDLTSKNVEFHWNSEHQLAFETLRDKLCSAPILQYPNFSEPFIVTTDASNYAVGAILSQGKVGQDPMVAAASRVLNKAERNYSTTEKEMVAVLFAIKTFRPYLYGREFLLLTDHRPLAWIDSMKECEDNTVDAVSSIATDQEICPSSDQKISEEQDKSFITLENIHSENSNPAESMEVTSPHCPNTPSAESSTESDEKSLYFTPQTPPILSDHMSPRITEIPQKPLEKRTQKTAEFTPPLVNVRKGNRTAPQALSNQGVIQMGKPKRAKLSLKHAIHRTPKTARKHQVI
ncbi:uncharacterized protein [Venturia canescens]|uniref:uncharacterized protein n=1 Tax=Venturia canescens TaxID=32260 RepID=UPI001C9BE5D0|nr:uncharacterized protein LOC122416553 [Venturia canescens]